MDNNEADYFQYSHNKRKIKDKQSKLDILYLLM